MCGGSDMSNILGGLIVAGAMLVWAFCASASEQGHRARHPDAERPSAQTSVVVSLDPLALEVRHGRISVELGI